MTTQDIITRMKAGEMVNITKDGKEGMVYFERTPTNLYFYYDMRLKIEGHVATVFDAKNINEIPQILEHQQVKLR